MLREIITLCGNKLQWGGCFSTRWTQFCYNSDLQVKKWQYKKEGSDWDIGENEEKKVKVQFKREHFIIFPGPD